MSYIAVNDINALSDGTKLIFDAVDPDLEASVVSEIFAQVGQIYDVSVWTSETTTPDLVVKIIAMFYVGWYYQRVYSEDDSPNNYGFLMIARGQRLLDGIVGGSVNLPDSITPAVNQNDSALFYPNDASSAMDPNDMYAADSSVGPASFGMGQVF